MLSNSLRDSTRDFNLASSSANFSASLIIFSMSSGVSLFWSFVMVIFSLLPVPLSSAETWRMPLASISKVTSIWGTPRGAGGMLLRSNLPRRWLSLVMGNSAGGWGDVVEVELAKKMVVLGHGSLSFKHLDGHSVLVISGGREDLRLLGWDNSVPGNELSHHSSYGFNSHGQWIYVKQHNFSSFGVSGENSSLDSGSIGDGFIRVDSSAWFLAVEELLDEL